MSQKTGKDKTMEKIVSLTKRRGFIFQSSEIYGGINSCYDYGPLGTELKKNIKELWWRSMVYERSDIEGIDSSILMHPKIWEASGHVAGFSDPLIDCRECKSRFRADNFWKYHESPSESESPRSCRASERMAMLLVSNPPISSTTVKPRFKNRAVLMFLIWPVDGSLSAMCMHKQMWHFKVQTARASPVP